MTQNIDKSPNLRQPRSQQSLDSNLNDISSKQSIITKLLLFFLVLLIFYLLGTVNGFLGGLVTLHILTGTEFRSVYFFTTLITTLGIVTSVCLNFSKGGVITILSLGAAFVIAQLLARVSLIEIPSNFLFALVANLIVELTICGISFIVFQFMNALIELLPLRDWLLKLSVYTTLALTPVSSALIVFEALFRQKSSGIKEIIETSKFLDYTITRNLTIGGGILLALSLYAFAKQTNRSANIPWTHPNGFRNLALATASWRATSFYDLDLSNINFSGARLANTDLRAKKLYRTQFQGATGLERARVDSRYLDLEYPKVQRLLTRGYSEDQDFSRLTLRGAYLKGADLRHMQFIGTDLSGADLNGADLRDTILLRAIATDVDFTGADLTGACIKDWSINNETQFEGVTCDYVCREYEDDRPTDRYPPDRNFEPGEFQSLFQKLTNAVELVFKDQVNWRALSFTFDKFRLEDDGLELELKGVEQRGDYWIVKVTHKEGIPRQEVEQKVIATYEDLRGILAAKDQQINQLMGIMENQASTLQNQSEALTNYSTQPFGNIFNIIGSAITNLAGSGHIGYTEAANQVRSIIAQGSDPAQMTQELQQLLAQFQQQNVATTPEQQAELLRQLILSEAEKDEIFKGFLKQQGQQILQGMPPGAIASAIYSAIEQLK